MGSHGQRDMAIGGKIESGYNGNNPCYKKKMRLNGLDGRKTKALQSIEKIHANTNTTNTIHKNSMCVI